MNESICGPSGGPYLKHFMAAIRGQLTKGDHMYPVIVTVVGYSGHYFTRRTQVPQIQECPSIAKQAAVVLARER
jgi:hypothetical protein